MVQGKNRAAKGWSFPDQGQVSPWEGPPSEGPWLPAERIQEQVIALWKQVYSGKYTLHWWSAPSQKVRAALGDTHSIDRVPSVSKSESRTEVCGWLVFMGWVLSLAKEWEEYSNYLGEGSGISRSWASPTFRLLMASNLPACARDEGDMDSILVL